MKLNEIQIEKVPHEKWLRLDQNKVEIATKNRDTLLLMSSACVGDQDVVLSVTHLIYFRFLFLYFFLLLSVLFLGHSFSLLMRANAKLIVSLIKRIEVRVRIRLWFEYMTLKKY